ncbi:FAD-dependent oxidoreductase [Kitasatospora sp. NPDC101155]|uniref:FAD-dependent oxidoreductase n=1 Tax=Kitasatospora sp. NPDC101155 TaxID=3364097 RepID=UPI0037F9F9B9
MLACLRLVYFTRQDTRDAGFIETDHYGARFNDSGSHFGLLGLSQRWLRDLVWDYFDARLRNQPPRSQGPLKLARRSCVELSAYLEAQAPGGGHDPRALTEEHMTAFVADQRHRALHGLPALGHDPDVGMSGGRLQAMTLSLLEGWHPRMTEIVSRQDPASIFPVAVRTSVPVAAWETDAVTLLGDAVHVMSPAIGVGANTALRDARVLASRLVEAADGRPLTAALRAYEDEMRGYGFDAVRESAEHSATKLPS